MAKLSEFFNGVRLDFMDMDGESLKVEGSVDYGVILANEVLVATLDGKEIEVTHVPRRYREKTLANGNHYDGGAFEVVFYLDNEQHNTTFSLYARSKNGRRKLKLLPQEFTRLSEIKFSYARYGDFVCYRSGGSSIRIKKSDKFLLTLLEARFMIGILFYWRLANAKAALVGGIRDGGSLKRRIINLIKPLLIIAESIMTLPRAFYLRTHYHMSKRSRRRPVWLISDRGMSAGDNGEALFRYIMKRSDCPADVYFVLSRKSKDYKRLAEIGPVLDQDSTRYKKLFLLADKVISSQADVEVTNPFVRQKNHFIDLYTYDFVFLQHGIIRHDLSEWLNRFNKNIRLFITSAQVEYDSIVNGDYYYEEKRVLLSGMPRYDFLESNPKSKLILAPTYRKELVRLDTDRNGARPYDQEFKKSNYRDFYNRLMNDPRLLAVLKKHEMTGELYLHPVFASQIVDFESNDLFRVKDFPYNYKEAFREGSVMVSDYSSVVFDFSYLKKPVVYSQFDKEIFFEHHMYQEADFFSDEKDGFGPVTYDYETTLSTVIGVIEGGCIMEAKYRERVGNFFFKQDKENSKRVYEAIASL